MLRYLKCEVCGSLLEIIEDHGKIQSCCGKEMTPLIENMTDASSEKHIPVIKLENNIATIKVGETTHPMEKNHYIKWVNIKTTEREIHYNLKPEEEPIVTFKIDENERILKVYSYCNLHGLWLYENKLSRKTIEGDEEYLRQISKPVDFDKDDWKKTIETLEFYCKNEENCMAMASVQLGIPLRLIYLKKTDLDRLYEDYNEGTVMINPRILKSEGKTIFWEACASCLDYTGLVERPYKIELEYYDVNKEKHIETFEGFPCTVLSHEIDHLDGILHMDIAKEIKIRNNIERVKLRKENPYKIISKEGTYIHPIKSKDQ